MTYLSVFSTLSNYTARAVVDEVGGRRPARRGRGLGMNTTLAAEFELASTG